MAELATALAPPQATNGIKVPPPSTEELQLLRFLDGLDSEATEYQKALVEQWNMAISLFKGHIWPEGAKAPFFLANVLTPLIDKQTSLFSDAKPIIRVMARRAGLKTTETVLQKTLMAGWDEYGLNTVMDEVGYSLNLFSAAFLSNTWDPMAAFAQGDLCIEAADPRMIRFDPMVTRARDMWRGQYVIQDSIVPLWQVWRMFPGRGQLVMPNAALKSTLANAQRTSSTRGGLKAFLQSFSPASKQAQAAAGAVPRVHLRHYWFHDPTIKNDGTPLYPAGRSVMRDGEGSIILDDRANPYWDGGWPIVMCDSHYDPDSPWGRVEILAYQRLQEAINRIGHLFVENTILSGNVWVTADSDALEPSLLQKLSNLGAIVIRKRFGRTVERNEPPQMPPHFLDFIRMAMTMIEELSGLSDTTVSGRGRVELRSGEQLEGLQAAAQTLIRSLSRRVEGFLERLGALWVSRLFQFYTGDRMLTFLGPGTEWMTYQFERRQLLEEVLQGIKDSSEGSILAAIRKAHQAFLFRVVPGSSLATVRMARAKTMADLAERGMVSRVKVLEELGFPNPEEEIERAMKEAQMMQPGPSATGTATAKQGGVPGA